MSGREDEGSVHTPRFDCGRRCLGQLLKAKEKRSQLKMTRRVLGHLGATSPTPFRHRETQCQRRDIRGRRHWDLLRPEFIGLVIKEEKKRLVQRKTRTRTGTGVMLKAKKKHTHTHTARVQWRTDTRRDCGVVADFHLGDGDVPAAKVPVAHARGRCALPRNTRDTAHTHTHTSARG